MKNCCISITSSPTTKPSSSPAPTSLFGTPCIWCTAANPHGFAAWLILQGKSTYLGVLHDPDRLADTDAAPNYCSGSLKGHEHEFPEQRAFAARLYRERTRTGIRAFKKTAAEFARKAHAEWESAIRQELNIPNRRRDRTWSTQDLASILPHTYRKYILHGQR